jgi:ABC-type antimicrobial peptide transport system permease subunit
MKTKPDLTSEDLCKLYEWDGSVHITVYGVGSLDVAALLGALVTLAVVAFIACYLPARRASLVNPIEALRTE